MTIFKIPGTLAEELEHLGIEATLDCCFWRLPLLDEDGNEVTMIGGRKVVRQEHEPGGGLFVYCVCGDKVESAYIGSDGVWYESDDDDDDDDDDEDFIRGIWL